MKELVKLALEEAERGGASYADARFHEHRSERLLTMDKRVAGVNHNQRAGFGIRVLVDGAWGYAATNSSDRDEVLKATHQALDIAKEGGRARHDDGVHLMPEQEHRIDFKSPFEQDPFQVPTKEKIDHLLNLSSSLIEYESIARATAMFDARKDTRIFMNTEGIDACSEVITTAASMTAVAVGAGSFQTRTFEMTPSTRGYEAIDWALMKKEVDRVARQAKEKLTAPIGPSGVTDLVLDPLHLALTIHESVGHATELDRVLGMEESLAGSSFATIDKLSQFRYGSDMVNFEADNTMEGGLATWGFDDEGVPGQRWHIVKDGILNGYSTSRETAMAIDEERSRGSCRSDFFTGIPIVRIPNLSLMPGSQSGVTAEKLIQDVENGIFIEGMGSFSIDQKRLNFQFGGDCFWKIKNGKLDGMLRDVTYQSITPEFWGACDGLGSDETFEKNGVLMCGKGDPMQINRMTHGAVPARFRGIKVGAAMETQND